jgi:hypothetical protein
MKFQQKNIGMEIQSILFRKELLLTNSDISEPWTIVISKKTKQNQKRHNKKIFGIISQITNNDSFRKEEERKKITDKQIRETNIKYTTNKCLSDMILTPINTRFRTFCRIPLAFDSSGELRYFNSFGGSYLNAIHHGLVYDWRNIDAKIESNLSRKEPRSIVNNISESWTIVTSNKTKQKWNTYIKKLPGIISQMINDEFFRREEKRKKMMAGQIEEIANECLSRKWNCSGCEDIEDPEDYEDYENYEGSEDYEDYEGPKNVRSISLSCRINKVHQKKHFQRSSKKQNSKIYFRETKEKFNDRFPNEEINMTLNKNNNIICCCCYHNNDYDNKICCSCCRCYNCSYPYG